MQFTIGLIGISFLCTAFIRERLRWAGHVARMEEGRSAFKILTVTNPRERDL